MEYWKKKTEFQESGGSEFKSKAPRSIMKKDNVAQMCLFWVVSCQIV